MAKDYDDDETPNHPRHSDNRHEPGGIASLEDGDRGTAKEEKNQAPVGFWHSDLKSTRFSVFKAWAITTLILAIAILAVLSLYWGVLFHVEDNLSALVVWVVDFDSQVAPYTGITPVVGPQIVKVAQSLVAPSGSLGWGSLPASQFNYDPMEVRQQIYDFKAWAAIIINPNATALLQDSIRDGNSSYDPMGVAQIIYVEARDDTTIDTYILPQLMQFAQLATDAFGKIWVGQVLEQAQRNASILNSLSNVPQALNPAIGFSTYNLRPFFPPAAIPSVTIGLIYLIIIAFFSYTFYLPHHMKFVVATPGHRRLKFGHLIIWRWLSAVCAYFFLSFAYSVISLAFQIPFTAPPGPSTELAQPATAYGHASFVVYWMVNWIGMIALGLACENVAMIVGMPWTSLWLIFWVITNVSTSFYSIDLAPAFYRWGYSWPLHNIVEASRSILFDLHPRIGLNIGVLFAWCAIDTVLFPLACIFQQKQTAKKKKQEAQEKEK